MVDTFLEQILPDRNKLNLLTFFIASPERGFYVGELQKRLNSKNLQSALDAFVKSGLLKTYSKKSCKYYILNKKNPLLPELKSVYSKAVKNYEDEMVKYLQKLPGLKTTILTGVFTGNPNLECDIVFVGTPNQKSLENFMEGAQKIAGQELNYAVFTEKEFEYRKHIFDRFMKEVLDNDNLVINKKTK